MEESVTTAQLKADLAAVLRDAEMLIKATSEQGSENFTAAAARVRESLEAAKLRLRDAEIAARRHGEDAVHATEDYVKQNPWQAIGIAAGVGLIVGVLLARR